jgi:hypothetical protein
MMTTTDSCHSNERQCVTHYRHGRRGGHFNTVKNVTVFKQTMKTLPIYGFDQPENCGVLLDCLAAEATIDCCCL